jgi:hypothetical protein
VLEDFPLLKTQAIEDALVRLILERDAFRLKHIPRS